MLQGKSDTLAALDKLQWYHTRHLCYIAVRGYADPKKAPKDIEQWWPLSNVKKRRVSVKKLKEIAAEINAKLNATLNG